MVGPMITVTDLTKRYGPTVAVDGVSFTLQPGTVTGFLGHNGAGKSTTLRMICGLVRPTTGTATIDGRRYRDLPHPAATVGTLLDAAAVHPGRTGRNHLRVLAGACGVGLSRADELLEQVGLTVAARRRVGGYSLGMRQRLGLAGAMLTDPPVLLLDEPATGLDPEGIRWMRGFLREQAARGRTVLLSSHLLAEVAQTVDRVVVLHAGRLVADDDVDGLLGRIGADVVVRSHQPAALLTAVAQAGWTAQATGPDTLVVSGPTSPDELGLVAAQAGVPVLELRRESAGLENAFFALTSTTDHQEQARR
jgi:ABC-2 type transport system ATP-binding protein